MGIDPRLFSLFVAFSKEHLRSGDFDPNYFVLRSVFDGRRYSEETRLDHIFCYLGCYDLRTADYLGKKLIADGGFFDDTSRLVKGTQRRGFRGNDLFRTYFAATRTITIEKVRGLVAESSPTEGWTRLRELLETVPHVGTYTSFKFCDLISYAMDFRITSPDIGTGGNGVLSGPIPGLMRLTGETWEDCVRKFDIQREVYERSLERGVPFRGYEEMETCLCDFNKTVQNRYYVGQDIDEQMEWFDSLDAGYWEARTKRFPPEYLGEFGGWFGIRKALKKDESRWDWKKAWIAQGYS